MDANQIYGDPGKKGSATTYLLEPAYEATCRAGGR